MIEVRVFVKLRSGRYVIALYEFEKGKIRSVIEALNKISENPIDADEILSMWPLGDARVVSER